MNPQSSPPCPADASRMLMRVAVGMFLLVFTTTASAQTSPADGMTPSGLAPGAPTGSYGLSGFDTVNLYNGNLNVALPLLGVGGRGGAQSQVTLKLETTHWIMEKDSIDGLEYYYPNPNWWEGIKPGYGPGVLQARVAMVPAIVGQAKQTLTRLTFTAPDGTEYQLVDMLRGGWQYGGTCIPNNRPRGRTFVSHDGAFVTFVSRTDLFDTCIESVYSDGISGFLYFPDGTRYEITDGNVTKARDRNGNLISYSYDSFKRVTTIVDSLNRQVTVTYADLVSTFYDQISYKGFGGAARSIKIWHASLSQTLRAGDSIQTYQQLFGGTDQTPYNPNDVVSVVQLSDGRSYSFLYNSFGELARIVLPTGGAIEYDYVEMGAQVPTIQRRVSERRVYADGVTLESKQLYAATYNGTTTTVVEQRDASNVLLGKSVHYFYSDPISSINNSYTSPLQYSHWQEGREFKSEALAADGVTVLRRSESTWEQGATVTSWLASQNAANNPRVNAVVTTLVDTNQVSKQTFTYDHYNNTTDVYEYDYGLGAAGSLVRRTHSDFMTTNPVNGVNYASAANELYFYRLPAQTSVFDAAGIERARSSFEYDNYTVPAPLVDRAHISGFDSTFTTSYVTRANATRTTRYLLNASGSVVGSISTYAQFDIAGHTVKATDGRGYETHFYFDDNFGAPDGNARLGSAPVELSSAGQSSYALLTKVTNALNQTAWAQYDFYLGRAVDGEDMNGVVATAYFDDVLDRPTKVIRDYNNLAGKSQMLFSYDDTGRVVTTKSDFATFNDQLLRQDSLYDGLGRTIETRAFETATQYITVKTVPFTVLQDPDSGAWVAASQVSNPFRSGSPIWTDTFTDALGRVTKVRAPDNAITRTSYSGNTVMATDPTGKARKSVSDALGRMTSVYEDPSGLNYQTSYSYDTLDNLVSVNQGVQVRTFVYDSLKRVASASNPESGTTTYSYDQNGNLLTRTDARNIVTTIAYDALNRPTSRSYANDGGITPAVAYFYDSQTLPGGAPVFNRGYSTGRLVAVTYGGGSAGDYLGADALGRTVLKIQQTGGVNYQSSGSFNVSGTLTSETYPSGRVVNFSYDSAGRASSVVGTLGDGTQRTYSTGISYSAFGGLAQEQFGTTTPLFHKLHYNVRGQLYDLRVSTSSLASDEWNWNRGALVWYYGAPWGQSSPTNNGDVTMQQHWAPANDAITDYRYTQQSYSYADPLNRLSSVTELHGSPSGPSATDFVQAYSYDRYGNRTIDASATWGAGVNNKQFSVDTNTNRLGVPAGQSGTMSFDAVGNLVNDSYTGEGTRTFDAENRLIGAQASLPASYAYDADGQRIKRVINGTETWLIYGLGGVLLAEYAANASPATPQKEYGYRNGEMLITAEAGSGSSPQSVNWANVTGVSVSGNTITKTAGYGWGNAGAVSTQVIANGDGYVEFTAAQLAVERICGLSHGDSNQNHDDIDFGILLSDGGYIYAWESGVMKTNAGAYAASDVLRVAVENGQVKYYRNGTLFYTSTATPTYPLIVDTAIRNTGASISNVLIASGSGGSSANVRWLVKDQLGTPRMVFDQTGSLTNMSRHDYLPFGEEVPSNFRTGIPGYATVDNVRQKFTGYEKDAETDLNFAQARYQSATQGRFTSADPFGPSMRPIDPQSFNRYSYTGNNPVNRTDPTGLDWESDASKWAASTRYGHHIGSGWSVLNSKAGRQRDFQGSIEPEYPEPESARAANAMVWISVIEDTFAPVVVSDSGELTGVVTEAPQDHVQELLDQIVQVRRNLGARWKDFLNEIETNKNSNISTAIVLCQASQESSFLNLNYTGSGFEETTPGLIDEIGLLQIRPATAQSLGVNPADLTNVATNVTTGTGYLTGLLNRNGGNLRTALGKYKGGSGPLTEASRRYADQIIQCSQKVKY